MYKLIASLLLVVCVNCDGNTVIGSDAGIEGRSLSATCDKKEISYAVAEGSQTYLIQTRWFSEVPIPGFTPENPVLYKAVLCDYTCFGETCKPCPDGQTCVNQGYSPPTTDCIDADANTSVEEGGLVVFCGSQLDIKNVISTQNDRTYGGRFDTLYIHID